MVVSMLCAAVYVLGVLVGWSVVAHPAFLFRQSWQSIIAVQLLRTITISGSMLELDRCLWWGVLCCASGASVWRSWQCCDVLAICSVVVVRGPSKIGGRFPKIVVDESELRLYNARQ